MTIKQKFLIVFFFSQLSIQSAYSQINSHSLEQSHNLKLILNAAQCANTLQNAKLSHSDMPPKQFLTAVKQIKRVADLRRLVFILAEMDDSEASLQSIHHPIERCFFHTINLIAKRRTPEAQDALDQIRKNCRLVGDAGGSLRFKQICRNNKMKCLNIPETLESPQEKEYVDLRK